MLYHSFSPHDAHSAKNACEIVRVHEDRYVLDVCFQLQPSDKKLTFIFRLSEIK